MTKQIEKLATAIKDINTESEILALIKGASLALNIDYSTLKKAVHQAYYVKYEQAGSGSASEASVYNSSNV